MIDERLRELELRQRALVLRSELQRRAIAGEGAYLAGRVGGVEGRLSLARRLVSLPALGVGATVLMAVVGPAKALRLASRVLVGVSLARRAVALAGRFASARRPASGPSPEAAARRD